MPLRKEYFYAATGLALLFAIQAIAVVAHQMYGPGQINYLRDLAGYMLSISATSLCLDMAVRRSFAVGRAYKPGAVMVFALLLLPVCISIVTVILRRMSFSSPFSDFFRTLVWAAYLPICLHFFRTRLPLALQTAYLPLCMGLGHVCWVVLTPLLSASITGNDAADQAVKQQYQILLHLFCVFLAVGIAAGISRLVSTAPVYFEKSSAAKIPGQSDFFPKHFTLFMLPLAAITFLNGLCGNLISIRLQVTGSHPGFIHLMLLAFFCWYAFAARMGKTPFLKQLVYGLFILLLSLPLFLLLPAESAFYQVWLIVCTAGHQMLLFTVLLICLLFAPHSRYPLLVSCSGFIMAGIVNLCGEGVARFILPLLPVSQFAAACICSALCLFLLPLLGKVFPLPETPQESFAEGSATDASGQNGLAVPEASTASIAAFAEHHAFAPREVRILKLLCQKASSEEMLQALGIKESSLRTYISHMLKKTGAVNRVELAVRVSGFQAHAPALHPSPADSARAN